MNNGARLVKKQHLTANRIRCNVCGFDVPKPIADDFEFVQLSPGWWLCGYCQMDIDAQLPVLVIHPDSHKIS